MNQAPIIPEHFVSIPVLKRLGMISIERISQHTGKAIDQLKEEIEALKSFDIVQTGNRPWGYMVHLHEQGQIIVEQLKMN